MLEYLDLDLLIERRDDHYRARVIDSPAGQASGEFELPFSPLELENFFLRIGQPRTVRRQVRLGAPAYQNIVQEFGGKLYQAVFNDEMRAVLAQQPGGGAARSARACACACASPRPPTWPTCPGSTSITPTLNRFLALSVQTSLVRYLDLPERIAPLAVQPPLRMLVMISSPTDAQVLDVEQEWAQAQERAARAGGARRCSSWTACPTASSPPCSGSCAGRTTTSCTISGTRATIRRARTACCCSPTTRAGAAW